MSYLNVGGGDVINLIHISLSLMVALKMRREGDGERKHVMSDKRFESRQRAMLSYATPSWRRKNSVSLP